MMQHYAFNLQKDGAGQDQRLLAALQPGYFRVDERSFSDLMAWALRYAGLIRFINLDNQPEGDWQAFFAADEAFVLSSILAVNLDMLEADFMHFLANHIDSPANPIIGLVSMIDTWYSQCGALSSAAAARAYDKLGDVIEHPLREKYAGLCAALQIERLSELSDIWQCEPPADVPAVDAQFLKSCFSVFYNVLLMLQAHAEDILKVSMQRQNHDPALALYMAFLKLFTRVQGKINDFSQRHVQFYYQQVLKTQARSYRPASTFLLFQTDVAGREVYIEPGTAFKAGLDENQQTRLFTADEGLRVSDAQVLAVYSAYLARNELSFPENALCDEQGLAFVTAVRMHRLQPGEHAPLFADTRVATHAAARMGLAIASKTLLLQQGERTINVTLRLAAGCLTDFIQKLARVLNTTAADAFFKAFRQMFSISLTGERGWITLAEYLPLCQLVDEQCPDNSLTIRVILPDSTDAVVAYSEALHQQGLSSNLPMIKLCLNPDAYLYGYSFLSDVALREVQLEVTVCGYTDVVVYNQLGQLSGAAQFNPFGPLPVLGDYLVVGCFEAACKKLCDFSVDIQWGGLPLQGFEQHYRAYGLNFSTDAFQVTLGVLKDRKWLPQDMPLQHGLFGAGHLANQQISFQPLCGLLRPLEHISAEQYRYDNTAKDGFFKLTLSNPPYAFGHKDYPMALARVMSENAALKRFRLSKVISKKLPEKPLPNPAYTPLVQNIRVNYRAVSNITLESVASQTDCQDQVLHLHPLGDETLSGNTQHSCLPQLDAAGNVLLGIQASQMSGVLTLFFHLRADSMPGAAEEKFSFTWHYLTDNHWKALDQSQILADTTYGFLTSGIITLNIPPDINRANTILPDHCYWLRVSSNNRQLHTLCSLYAVYPHALKTTWQAQPGNALMDQVLPAGTITAAQQTLVGIREIRQIVDSFAGMPPESEQQQRVRVSERLRHKQRAVQAWDYERLVLQQFPEIQKVKCFPCMDGKVAHAQRARPGHVLLVLIPQQQAELNWQPMVNALLLNEVRSYVQSLAAANVTIHVRNPAYEQIQVRCKVKLRKGRGQGYYHNELNQELIEYLSPWSTRGLQARFGWSIRCDEIQAHIQRMDYVEAAAGVSLLQICEHDEKHYHLYDTARADTSNVIQPNYPWSIAIPAARHLIEILDEHASWQVEPTGIAKLAIGSTFILSRNNHD